MITEADYKAKEIIKKFKSPYISNIKSRNYAIFTATIIRNEMKVLDDIKLWDNIITAIEEYDFGINNPHRKINKI